MALGGRMRTTVAAAFMVVGLLAAVPSPASASSPDLTDPYRSGYVLVGYRDGVSPAARAEVRGQAGVALSRQLMPSADLLRLPTGLSVAEAISRLERDPRVAYAEPDYLLEASATSNDPYYTGGSLWGMYGDATSPANAFGSQAGEAWAAGYTGSSSVVIGVIDEGIDITHPDLAANIWKNPGESGGGKETNGIDDDDNGYIDDVNGWDFYYNNNTVFDGSADDHGTHVSGTIGGVGGNGAGVAGVNWNVTLISAKFLGPQGGSTSGAVSALQYLTNLKTRATNPVNIVATSNSWGGGGYSSTLRNAMIAAGNAGMLFVVAAGNSSVNIDSSPQYPAAYTCPTNAGFDCVISVASITSTGAMSSFSNYGSTSVDLGAPGSGIWSTLPGNSYGSYSGTSMATPHVSGAVALCASIRPSITAAQIRSAILDSVAPTSSLSGKTSTGGRLDVGAMAAACASTVAPQSFQLDVTVNGAGSGTVSGAGISCSTGQTGTCSADASGTVSLTASAGTGSVFSGWSGCGSTSGTSCTVSMTQARTVTATFGLQSYSTKITVSKPRSTSPTVSISTSGGSAWSATNPCGGACTSSLLWGTYVTFVANYATGASRVAWSGCDSVSGDGRSCYVTVNGSEAVTAKFSK